MNEYHFICVKKKIKVASITSKNLSFCSAENQVKITNNGLIDPNDKRFKLL
jgi:hypothetical protein